METDQQHRQPQKHPGLRSISAHTVNDNEGAPQARKTNAIDESGIVEPSCPPNKNNEDGIAEPSRTRLSGGSVGCEGCTRQP